MNGEMLTLQIECDMDAVYAERKEIADGVYLVHVRGEAWRRRPEIGARIAEAPNAKVIVWHFERAALPYVIDSINPKAFNLSQICGNVRPGMYVGTIEVEEQAWLSVRAGLERALGSPKLAA